MTDEGFKKFDTGKLDLTLVPTCHSRHYATIAQMGAKKYGRNNWKLAKLEDVGRYYAAMLRHQEAERDGIYLDEESGLPHGWHAGWNRTAVNYFIEKFGFEAVYKILEGIS